MQAVNKLAVFIISFEMFPLQRVQLYICNDNDPSYQNVALWLCHSLSWSIMGHVHHVTWWSH